VTSFKNIKEAYLPQTFERYCVLYIYTHTVVTQQQHYIHMCLVLQPLQNLKLQLSNTYKMK